MAHKASGAMIPQVFHYLLPRNQIAKIIDEASLSEAVYMVGPYGYGKTLAALSWLQERNRQAAWLTLCETDNAELAFAELLAASFSPFAINQRDRAFLSNPQNAGNLDAFLTETASRIVERGISADTLIIDNFHFIQDIGLLRSIKNFVYSLLGHIRVIILSRAELSPVFIDLILKRHICLITTKDLSFSIVEISEYFDINRCPTPVESLSQIHKDTEGWPAAINVILTTSRDGPIQYGEAARSYVRGFFETEIWYGLDESVKKFLLPTSMLDKLTPAACNAVTGIGATLQLLDWLFASGLFITKLDKDTYCYHTVFKDYLLDKLEASDIDEKSLYKNYAWWLFERNEFEQSLPCFFKANDLYGINQVAKILNPATMNNIDEFIEVMGFLTTLDIENLKSYPIIVARIALIEYLKGNIDRFQQLYCTLAEWIDPGVLPVTPEEYAEYVWEVGWLCYLNPAEPGNNDGGIARSKHTEWCNYSNYVPHLKDIHFSRGAVIRFPSILRGLRDYCQALSTLELAINNNESAESGIITEEHALWEMNLILAEYLYEKEDYARAEEIVRRIMPLGEERRYTDLYFICTTLLVKVMRATHNTKEIDSLISRLEALIMDNKEYFLLPNLHAFQLREKLADGHIGFDVAFEKENEKCGDKPYYYLLYRQMTYVRGLISKGDYNEAVLILNNLELLCQKYKRTMDLIEVNILLSVSLYRLGGHEEACRYMTQALSEAKKYGFIRIFSDDAKMVWPVLELIGENVSGAYTKKVLLSCKKELMRSGYKNPRKRANNAKLTKTEIKILKCLQMGMSYKDIGVDNNILVSTVKSHAHSIYSKLDVNNRTSAIIVAQKQGVLEKSQ